MVVGLGSGIFPTSNAFLPQPQWFPAFSPEAPPSPHCIPIPQVLQHAEWKGALQREGRKARARTLVALPCMAVPLSGKLSYKILTAPEECKPKGAAHAAQAGRWQGGNYRVTGALATKGDSGPFMCFTKVAKLRLDYNCSNPCQGWKVGSLKYAPAVLIKSLKSNKREKRAGKVTCITLIKEKSHGEVVNLNHCLNFNLFINRICPSLRMLLLPFADQQQL